MTDVITGRSFRDVRDRFATNPEEQRCVARIPTPEWRDALLAGLDNCIRRGATRTIVGAEIFPGVVEVRLLSKEDTCAK